MCEGLRGCPKILDGFSEILGWVFVDSRRFSAGSRDSRMGFRGFAVDFRAFPRGLHGLPSRIRATNPSRPPFTQVGRCAALRRRAEAPAITAVHELDDLATRRVLASTSDTPHAGWTVSFLDRTSTCCWVSAIARSCSSEHWDHVVSLYHLADHAPLRGNKLLGARAVAAVFRSF